VNAITEGDGAGGTAVGARGGDDTSVRFESLQLLQPSASARINVRPVVRIRPPF
jgi:hypothetical protein